MGLKHRTGRPGTAEMTRSQRAKREAQEYDHMTRHDDHVLTIHGPPKPQPNFTYKLKIALTFAQICTNLATGLEIQWPNRFREFLLYFNVLNFDFILLQGSSTECVGGLDYYRRFLMVAVTPVLAFVLITVLYLLPRYMGLACFRNSTATARLRATLRFWKMFLYILFLIYPGMCCIQRHSSLQLSHAYI